MSWEFIHRDFFKSFSDMTMPSRYQKVWKLGGKKRFQEYRMFNTSFPIDLSRNQMIAKSLELGADFLIFLDADMVHPKETLPRLLEHMIVTVPDAGAVSVLYHVKSPKRGYCPVSGMFVDGKGDHPLYISQGCASPGLHRVDVIGMGGVIIRREALLKIPKPWFRYQLDPESKEQDLGPTITEDMHFCQEMKRLDIPIYVDNDLRAGHLVTRVVDETTFRPMAREVFDEDGFPMVGTDGKTRLTLGLDHWPGNKQDDFKRFTENHLSE
jgi:hypothetical protein